MMNDFDKYIYAIQSSLPNLIINDINTVSGYNSFVVIINNELVFKFPLNSTDMEKIVLREKLILEKIKSSISTNIPIINIFNYNELTFSCHKMIQGELYSKLNSEQKSIIKETLSKNLAKFIYEMHSVRYDFLHRGKSLIEGFFIKENSSLIKDFLEDKDKIRDFENCLNVVQNFNAKEDDYVLCHNDLNPNNIIIDLENKCLSGIIDFGNTRIENFNVEFSIIAKKDINLLIETSKEYEKLSGRVVNIDFLISVEKLRSYGCIGLSLAKAEIVNKKFLKDLDLLYNFNETYRNIISFNYNK